MINDTVQILKLFEDRNNELTDEVINYPGQRYYFDAGKIVGKNIRFTITYKKTTKELGYEAESNHNIGIEILKKVFLENEELLNEKVGLKLSLDKADKNPNWYRLRTNIVLNDIEDITNQIDKVVISFDKFRKILRDLVNKIDISEVGKDTGSSESVNKKISSDSWVDEIKIDDSDFIGRKTMDYSMFNQGTFIPERYQEKFLKELFKTLKLGSSISIKLIIDGVEYQGKIDMPNSKNRKTPAVRLLYSSKALKELLKENLQVSYDYIMNYIDKNDKKPNKIPEKYKEYIDFYKGKEKDTFILKLISKKDEEQEELGEEFDEDIKFQVESKVWSVTSINDEIRYIHKYISSKGFDYSEELIKNFYLSIKTKPFVILSGISGTGKSKIVELFAEAVGANYKNKRFTLIPVKPDWSDGTELLGYRNIESKFTPGIITSVAYEAMRHPDKPYFICLDEMNLARVEYYFSDILSLMETRKLNNDGEIITENLLKEVQFGNGDIEARDKYGDVYIPENLYIVGTVNMDETTFPFSKKVLDRANTIEFNKVNLKYNFDVVLDRTEIEERVYSNEFLKSNYLKISQCKDNKDIVIKVIDELIKINDILEEYNQHFGFRVRDEIVFYMIYAVKNSIMDFDKAMDYCIIQKILPKINGSNSDVLEILVKIFNILNYSKINVEDYLDESTLKEMAKKSKESNYKLSSEKLLYMIRRFVKDGFTTFWQ